MTCNELVERLHDKIGEMLFLIEEEMRSSGDKSDKSDKSEDCQKIYLMNRLYAVEHAVNGIKTDDMKNS